MIMYTWRSMNKDKPDIDKIRESGKRVVLWHGESDTLYKVMKPLKPKSTESKLTRRPRRRGRRLW